MNITSIFQSLKHAFDIKIKYFSPEKIPNYGKKTDPGLHIRQ
jgi:hypothetical protein